MSDPVRPDLDAIEALLNAGTPGPWHAGYASACCHLDHGKGIGGHGTNKCRYTFDGWIGEEASISRARDWQPDDVVPDERDDLVAGMWDYEEGGVRCPEDVALIVASVNAAPALIAYARALEAQLEAYRERQARYEDALEARTLAIPVVRREERERIARRFARKAADSHLKAHATNDLEAHMAHLADARQHAEAARAIRALPDREEPDA